MTTSLSHLTGKNILVISPQSWGVMHVSKHHYAIELARMGNQVYFLNPPLFDAGLTVAISPHDSIDNLSLVTYHLFFPYNLRFHMRWLYDRLMRWQMRRVLNKIGVAFDIAWCFDTNLFADLRVFGAKKVVYHIADQIMNDSGVSAAATADLVIAVDQTLLSKLVQVDVPKQVVGHGLAEPFALQAEKRLANEIVEKSNDNPKQVGYVGNLLITSLDRKTFKQIIDIHKDVIFHFWGSYVSSEKNICGGNPPETLAFVDYLNSMPNVILHGAIETERLAEEIQSMDVFLLCYDVCNDINGGCNSHKMLEYLSTGKVVVSSHLSSYEKYNDLVRMSGKQDNSDLLRVFSKTVLDLQIYNDPLIQKSRLQFALNNRYTTQIIKIDELLSRCRFCKD